MTTLSHSNFFAHRMLTDQGACSHTHEPETWEDVGDGESGPCLSGGPAFDHYQGESHEFIIDQTGLIVHCMPTDWNFARWCDEMASQHSEGPEEEEEYQRQRKTGEDWQVSYTDEDGPWYACYGGYGFDSDPKAAGFFSNTEAEQIAYRFNKVRNPAALYGPARIIDRRA